MPHPFKMNPIRTIPIFLLFYRLFFKQNNIHPFIKGRSFKLGKHKQTRLQRIEINRTPQENKLCAMVD